MNRLTEVLLNKEDNYILPFFWQHGEEEAVLREYMQVIFDSNIRAVCIESRPHPDFCGEKWWKDMDVILEEAKRLNMQVWILDDSHFPTGFANGALKNAPDELHHQYMVYRTLEVCGPVKGMELCVSEYVRPEPLPPWMMPAGEPEKVFTDDTLVKVLACEMRDQEKLGRVIDLTEQKQGDILELTLPGGYWKIYVIYLTRNAKGRNDYINFMDHKSCKLLLDAIYEPHYEHYKEYFGNVIKGFFSDEPPIGNTEGYMLSGKIGNPKQNLPWSEQACDRLTKEFGSEDWTLSIPYLWADATEIEAQAKIRTAYMNMVTKLVQECFSKQNGAWCEAHGVEYIGHMLEDCDMNTDLGPSMGHFFRGLSGQHMAGIDNIGGQVMIGGQNTPRHIPAANPDEAGFYQYLLGKLGASHAAIDAKKKGRCMCENFGAYGWQFGTRQQKYMMDHFLVRGVNRYVPHAFSAAPFPDPDCPPHFYAHGENPMYHAFGSLMAYSNRVCHLIDGGVAHPDVAVLYNAESKWAGEAASNIGVARTLTQNQIDFHIVPADAFYNDSEYQTSFDGEFLTIHKNKYSALLLCGCEMLDKEVAKFCEMAEAKGYPVFFIDRYPVGLIDASEQENESFQKLVKKKNPIPLQELGMVLKKTFTQECSIYPAFQNLTTYHYESDTDQYLILNEDAEHTYEGTITVKSKGNVVLYRPWENKIYVPQKEETGEGTKISICIRPLELTILSFMEEKELLYLTKDQGILLEGIDKDLTLYSLNENATEISQLTVSKLESKEYHDGKDDSNMVWEEVKAPYHGMQDKYPDFSGFYIYKTEICCSTGAKYVLAIEEVCESVEVFINGKSAGVRLQSPYAFDISDFVQNGSNQVRIEVATLLERKLRSQGFDIRSMSPYRPLSPTGILGKVTLFQA